MFRNDRKFKLCVYWIMVYISCLAPFHRTLSPKFGQVIFHSYFLCFVVKLVRGNND